MRPILRLGRVLSVFYSLSLASPSARPSQRLSIAAMCVTGTADTGRSECFLHEYLLAFWGVPIGEIFDLQRLSQECRAADRWTSFLTSAPANVHREFRSFLPSSRI